MMQRCPILNPWVAILPALALGFLSLATGIEDTDFEFISLWTDIPVDLLKTYQTRLGETNLVTQLTQQAFQQKEASWPLFLKLSRLRGWSVPPTSELGPEPSPPVDQLLALYKPWHLQQMFKAGKLKASPGLLSNVSSKHLSQGQAAVLIGELQSVDSWATIPPTYAFALASDKRFDSKETDLRGLLGESQRMFPSQRHALYQRWIKQDGENVSSLVGAALKLDLADVMISYVTPDDFRKQMQLIREELKALSEDEQLNAVYLPDALLTLWQEDIASSSAFLATHTQLTLRGMSCASIKIPEANKIPDIASAYNNYVLAKHPDRLKTVPISLRKCFAQRVRDYLTEKVELGSKASPMTKLTTSEAQMIGGTFLSSFTLTELKSIEDKSVLEEVLKAIGSIPLAELLPLTHSLKLTNLTDLALGGKSSLAFRDLDGLGTLAFFLQPEKWASIEPEDIRKFVRTTLHLPHHKCLCLPKVYLEGIGRALIRGFGQPQDLKPSDLVDMDELLVALDASSLAKLNVKSLVSALPYLLRNRTFHDRHYDTFPGFIGTAGFVQACSYWLDSDEDSAAFVGADQRLARTFLSAAQLSVDLAVGSLTQPKRRSLRSWHLKPLRQKRQVIGSQAIGSNGDVHISEKLVQYLTDHPPTVKQQDEINAVIGQLEAAKQKFGFSVLGVDIYDEGARDVLAQAVRSKNFTEEKFKEIYSFYQNADRNETKFLINYFNLNASVLRADRRIFCEFMGRTNCNQIPVEEKDPGIQGVKCGRILKGSQNSNAVMMSFLSTLKCFNSQRENSQLGRALSSTDIAFVGSLNDKINDILEKKRVNGGLTPSMSLLLVQENQSARDRFTQEVLKVLKVSNVPNTTTAEEYASIQIRQRNLTVSETDQLSNFADEEMKKISKRVIEIAKLTAEDFGVDPASLCRILDVCAPKVESGNPPSSSTSSTIFTSSSGTSTTSPLSTTTFLTSPLSTTTFLTSPSSTTTSTTSPSSTSTTTMSTTTLPLAPLVIDLLPSPKFVTAFKLSSESLRLPTRISCDAVLTAGPAASSLLPSDLESWSEFEILNCLEVLGNIEWSIEVRSKVADIVLDKTRSLERVKPVKFSMGLLKYLLEPLVSKKPELFEFDFPSIVEPLSALGDLDLSQETISSFASKLTKANRLDQKDLYDKPTVFHLLSLNQFLCGFQLEVIDKMFKSFNDHRSLLNSMGAIRRCNNSEILSFFANKAEQVIPQPWKASDIKSLGVILAGLTPSKLVSLSNESLGALTDTAIAHLTPEFFNVLTADHLNLITPESLSVLNLNQLPKEGSSVLDSSQMAYIDEVSMNLRQYRLLSQIYKSRFIQKPPIQDQPLQQPNVSFVKERQSSQPSSLTRSGAEWSKTTSVMVIFMTVLAQVF